MAKVKIKHKFSAFGSGNSPYILAEKMSKRVLDFLPEGSLVSQIVDLTDLFSSSYEYDLIFDVPKFGSDMQLEIELKRDMIINKDPSSYSTNYIHSFDAIVGFKDVTSKALPSGSSSLAGIPAWSKLTCTHEWVESGFQHLITICKHCHKEKT